MLENIECGINSYKECCLLFKYHISKLGGVGGAWSEIIIRIWDGPLGDTEPQTLVSSLFNVYLICLMPELDGMSQMVCPNNTK